MSKVHNYVAVNCSLRVRDVAIILQYLQGAGYGNMSRGQAIKLAVRGFADLLVKQNPGIDIKDVRAAHAIVETLAPTNKRAMTFSGDDDDQNDQR